LPAKIFLLGICTFLEVSGVIGRVLMEILIFLEAIMCCPKHDNGIPTRFILTPFMNTEMLISSQTIKKITYCSVGHLRKCMA
jgi:hypothetical protein